MTGRKTISTLMFLVLALVGGRASADPLEAAALKMGRAGEELFLAGKYPEALNLFQALVQRFERPVGLIDTAWWNLGRCHEEMGNDEAALAAFTQYAKRVRNPGDQEAARDKLQQVQARLRALLNLDVSPDDAIVTIDGTKIGVLPGLSGFQLPPGRHVIQVSKSGYDSQECVVELAPRESRALGIVLRASSDRDGGSVRADWTKMRIGGVAATGVGGLIMVVGIVPLVLASQDKMEINSSPGSWSLRDRFRERLVVGYVLEGIGAAAVLSGAIVLVVDRVRRPFRRVDVSLTPVPGGAVAGISGAF